MLPALPSHCKVAGRWDLVSRPLMAAAPQAEPLCGRVAAMVSMMDLADRTPQALGDGETLSIGSSTLVHAGRGEQSAAHGRRYSGSERGIPRSDGLLGSGPRHADAPGRAASSRLAAVVERQRAGLQALRRDKLELSRGLQALKQGRPMAGEDRVEDETVLVDQPQALERGAFSSLATAGQALSISS